MRPRLCGDDLCGASHGGFISWSNLFPLYPTEEGTRSLAKKLPTILHFRHKRYTAMEVIMPASPSFFASALPRTHKRRLLFLCLQQPQRTINYPECVIPYPPTHPPLPSLPHQTCGIEYRGVLSTGSLRLSIVGSVGNIEEFRIEHTVAFKVSS